MHKNPSNEEIKNLLREARNVAVVGLSDKSYRTSHAIARALQDFGYRIFPVNPNLTGPVLGEKPYSTVADIEEPVDIVDVFRRSETVPPVAEDAVAAGAKVLWMQSGRRERRGSGSRNGKRAHRRYGPLHQSRLRRVGREVGTYRLPSSD